MTGIAEITCITDMTVVFTSNILFSLVKQRTSLHRSIMTGIAEITHITCMTVVFNSNILLDRYDRYCRNYTYNRYDSCVYQLYPILFS